MKKQHFIKFKKNSEQLLIKLGNENVIFLIVKGSFKPH